MSIPSITPMAVLLRDEGSSCRIGVEGLEHATRLLFALSKSFVFKTSEPIDCISAAPLCTFHVDYSSQFSQRKLAAVLVAVPGVRLRQESLRRR